MNSRTKNIKGAVFADDRGFVRFVNEFDFTSVKRFYQFENHSKGFIGLGTHMKKRQNTFTLPRGLLLLAQLI